MQNLNRRDFFKATAATAAAAGAVACDPRVPKENALPYKVQPEQIVPGTPTFFATQCNECPASCGVVARSREGRTIKLEGNVEHPVNRGKLCAMGQQGIQATYSPDRFDGPMVAGSKSTWDAALADVKGALASAKGSGKIGWLGQSRSGATGALITQFMGALGGKVLFHEPVSGLDSLRAASKAVFGRDDVPNYHLQAAHTVVTFGAEFLNTWGDVSHSMGWADSRDPAKGGFVSRTVAVESRVGNTSAMADLHLQAAPGTEAMVAMALAKLVAEKKGYSGPAKSLVAGGDPAAAASAAGISAERLTEVAGWIAAGPSVILPGGVSTAADPTNLAIATLLLNEVAGNVGKTVTFGDGPNVANLGSHKEVLDLIAACAGGVLFLDGANPAFTLPAAAKAAAALAGTKVVAFANEANDSITGKAVVLPPGSTLETWGDAEARPGVHTLQQATMNPLKDTRQVGDVLLALSAQLGLSTPASAAEEAPVEGTEGDAPADAPAEGEEAAEPVVPPTPMPGLDSADFRTWLQGWWKAVVWDSKAGKPGSFETFWTDSLQRGGWFQRPSTGGAAVTMAAAPSIAAASPSGSGDMNLVLFPHPFLLDGRHANKPWAQEVPEPLSSYTWGTWAEIHPETAAKLGLGKKDEVTVQAGGASATMAWFGSPSIRKDTVAVVMGNGHEGAGRYAGFGSNPLAFIGNETDAGGALKVAGKASVSKAGSLTTMHQYIGNIDTDGRGVNYVVSKEDLGKGHGPASIVSMHHPPVDQRAIDAGILDMYPEPEHPTYRFAMAIDLNRCTGCGACETACFAENNTAIVGPEQIALSRHMGWIRLSRYWEGEGETPDVRFQPVMCQQCSHAPCEGVCPVLATYHNLDGLNAMVYNRCVGTRYCANNCPYTARRFNYHSYKWPESFNLMLNPDVLTREMGVMEKCSFCVQRLRATKDLFRDEHKTVPDAALVKLTACAQTCPSDAITFGNTNDADGAVSKQFQDERAYAMLGELNTKPGVRYLARINFIPAQPLHHGGHGGGGDHGDSHGDSHEKPEGGHGGGHDDHGGHGDKHGHDAKHSDKH